jgi:glutamate formiminotransferase/formiminotetrahydrofolate cyclodeaminase
MASGIIIPVITNIHREFNYFGGRGMRLVECVPNFSEGRNQGIIDAITSAIEEVDGAFLLDVDPGKDTNRTVVTFVAEYDVVVEAAFRAIKTAAGLIDMSKHHGAHARMGATDVCPFVPVRGVTMDDCVELADQLGKRVGKELGIPVYLYEHAAKSEDRRNLAVIRSGEYEGLSDKLKDPHWKPDYGPAEFLPRSGAIVIGAREFLIAYNVNLNTRDPKLANDIALSIREAGRSKRGPDGKFVRDENGVPIQQPGTLKAAKAVGWYIEEYQRAQISINLVNYHITSPHMAFEEAKRQAEERGLRVTGSELVGLIPLEAILETGRYYLSMQGKSTGVPESEIIETAIQSLGLREIAPFDPRKKIIEYRVAPETPLADLTLRGFADETSVDSPVPGGGSVAAYLASLAAALTSMVANLTIGKKDYREHDDLMKAVAPKAQAHKDRFLRAVDDDSRAFDAVMACFRLPKATEEELAHKEKMMEEATRGAIEVPFDVLKECEDAVGLIETVAEKGNVNSLSDAGVAALALKAAANGVYYNVLINLPGLSDSGYITKTYKEATAIVKRVSKACDAISSRVAATLDSQVADKK